MSVLRPGKFLVSAPFTRNTRIPRSERMSYNAIQHTPVDCLATVSMPHPTSQSAISCKSCVKHPKLWTGAGSRSGGTATQCSSLPTSIPAALGCTTCNPSVQSCGFGFARWFCFTRDFDFCGFALDVCVRALRREITRLGPVANGLRDSPAGLDRRFEIDAHHQTGDRLITGAMLKHGHKSAKYVSALTAEPRLLILSLVWRAVSDLGDGPPRPVYAEACPA